MSGNGQENPNDTLPRILQSVTQRLLSVRVKHPVVGELMPYGGLLGADVGFSHFGTETIVGLTKVSGDRIEFLALVALEPGRGHFTAFLEDLRAAYREIVVWEIWNERLEAMLRRQGFVTLVGIERGEINRGVAWRRAE